MSAALRLLAITVAFAATATPASAQTLQIDGISRTPGWSGCDVCLLRVAPLRDAELERTPGWTGCDVCRLAGMIVR